MYLRTLNAAGAAVHRLHRQGTRTIVTINCPRWGHTLPNRAKPRSASKRSAVPDFDRQYIDLVRLTGLVGPPSSDPPQPVSTVEVDDQRCVGALLRSGYACTTSIFHDLQGLSLALSEHEFPNWYIRAAIQRAVAGRNVSADRVVSLSSPASPAHSPGICVRKK
jgi:hypothetical protein